MAKLISSKANILTETNAHSLVEAFSCDSSSKECMYSTCEKCYDTRLKITDFRDEEADIHFYQWKRVDKKLQKIEVSLPRRRSNKIVQRWHKGS